MSYLWLIVWIIMGTPSVYAWNTWAVVLTVCMILDLLNTGRKVSD